MLNNRGILALSLMVIAISVMLMGFSDKLSKAHKPCDLTRIDNCARNGGLR